MFQNMVGSAANVAGYCGKYVNVGSAANVSGYCVKCIYKCVVLAMTMFLDAYVQDFFDELDVSIFGEKLMNRPNS